VLGSKPKILQGEHQVSRRVQKCDAAIARIRENFGLNIMVEAVERAVGMRALINRRCRQSR